MSAPSSHLSKKALQSNAGQNKSSQNGKARVGCSLFVGKLAFAHGLGSRPHALIWLSKVYAIPAGMYACQIWGTKYLKEDAEFDSHLQKLHLCSLKRLLGVKQTTANWPVLRECGQEPLQFYWFRAIVKFFNGSLKTNNNTLRQVMKADVKLSTKESSCWSGQVLDAFKGLRSGYRFAESMLALREVPLQDLISDLRFRHQRVWRDVDNVGAKGPFVPLPSYLYEDLPKHVSRSMSRFRRAHNLKVETGCWQDHTSMSCDKCGCNDLQDERHVLFYCNCERMCELRTKFADLFEGLFLPLQTFSRSSSMIPFLPTFQRVNNRDVTDRFLGQKNFRLCKSVAEMVQFFDS